MPLSSQNTEQFHELLDIIESAKPEDYVRVRDSSNQTGTRNVTHLFKLDPDLLPKPKKRKRRPLTVTGKHSSFYRKLLNGPDQTEAFVKVKMDFKKPSHSEQAPASKGHLSKLLNNYNRKIHELRGGPTPEQLLAMKHFSPHNFPKYIPLNFIHGTSTHFTRISKSPPKTTVTPFLKKPRQNADLADIPQGDNEQNKLTSKRTHLLVDVDHFKVNSLTAR